VAASQFEDLIGDVGKSYLRHSLGPSQSGALPIGEERRLAPGRQRVQPLFGFAAGSGVLGVHVDAAGTTVDLRGANLD
jgi:hypothetical protein